MQNNKIDIENNYRIKSKWIIYLLSFFIISFTFQNIFKFYINIRYIVIIFTIILFIFKCRIITKELIYTTVIFSLLIIVQGFQFGYSYITHFTSFTLNILLVYVLLRILPNNYYKYIVNVTYFLTIISLIFWALSNIYPSFREFIPKIAEKLDPVPFDVNIPKQIIIYTYENTYSYGFIRNSGFCHEPGAFAVILIYSIIFNYICTNKFINKKNIIFIFALLTTFSTAGYLSLYIFFFSFIYRNSRISLYYKIICVVFGLILSIYSFQTFYFMGDKIKNQYESQTSASLTDVTDGRILGARKAIYVIGKYPITGRGFTTASKVTDLSSKEAAGYGFAYFGSQVGIPLFILLINLFYKGMKSILITNNIDIKKTIILIISLLPVLFAQSFLPSLLFNLLFFETIFKRNLNSESHC